MFYNIRNFLKFAGRVVLQFLMVTLAVGGEKRGGKLSLPGKALLLVFAKDTNNFIVPIKVSDKTARDADALCAPWRYQ